jgi:fatty acid desaturase
MYHEDTRREAPACMKASAILFTSFMLCAYGGILILSGIWMEVQVVAWVMVVAAVVLFVLGFKHVQDYEKLLEKKDEGTKA